MADNVRFAFIFNKENKIQRALELAEKRLAEAEVLAEEDPERAARAQERYDDFVAKAEEILEKISEAKVEDENSSIDKISEMARIQNKFEQHREQTARIYARALERFENNNASDEKVERFEEFYDRALNRSDRMEARIIDKKNAAVKLHKVLAEKSDEELKVILDKIDVKEGLTEAREERRERAEVRVSEITDIRKKNIERVESLLGGKNLTDEQRKEIANRVEIANKRVSEFEVMSRERIEDRVLASPSVRVARDAVSINSVSSSVDN